MFKKAVEFKSQTLIGGKQLKKLRADAASVFPLTDECAAAILPAKAEISCRKLAQGGSKAMVYSCGNMPVIVDGGRGDYFPTVMGLWMCPDMLPSFHVPHQVSKFVCQGADLMMPGVRGMSQKNMPVKGFACVKVIGNPAPIAIGIVLFDPGSVNVDEGRVLQALHWYGDGLWEAAGRPTPNQGFADGYVWPIEGERKAAGGGEEGAGESVVGDDAGKVSGGGKAGGGVDVDQGGEGDAANHGGKRGVIDGDDDEEEGAACDARESGQERREGEEEGDEGGDDCEGEGGGAGGREAMDALLEKCFLQAVKTTVKDKDLPIEVSIFYLQHMRPAREVGTNLDVKRSTYKKLLPFLTAMQAQGLARMQTNKGITKLVSVGRSAPKYREFVALDAQETEGGRASAEKAREDAEAQISVPPVEVAELFVPHESMFAGIFEAGDKGRHFTAQECRDRLTAYIQMQFLVDPDDPSQVVLDQQLFDALYAGSAIPDPSPTHMKRSEVARIYTSRLQAWFEIRGGLLRHPRLERARMVECEGGVKEARPSICVNIKTENRRGHHVTVLKGLELLGVDAQGFADEMRLRFAASTSVNEVGGKDELGKHYEVMLQGYWDKTLTDYLIQQYKLPKVCLDVKVKKNQGEKAPKQAGNIVRS